MRTFDEIKAMQDALRTMLLDVQCPQGCDEGWVETRACAGHLCGWEGHWPTTAPDTVGGM